MNEWKVFRNHEPHYWFVSDKAEQGTVLAQCTTEAKAKHLAARADRLLPAGIPRWVRCYIDSSNDRYFVCFTGRASVERSAGCAPEYPYRVMSKDPFQMHGFAEWGSNKYHHCDVNKWGFAPTFGRKSYLGTRIRFQDLPGECQAMVLMDYKNIWRLVPVSLLVRDRFLLDT